MIIGFLGSENSGRTVAAKVLEKKGFYRASINSKVEEFASHLFSEEELKRERKLILNRVRERGCSVNKEYWLNLILISIPDDTTYIVFDDISMDEALNDKVAAYQIYRPNVSSTKLDDVETIENDGTLEDFIKKIEALHKKLL